MLTVPRVVSILVITVFVTQWPGAKSSGSNATRVELEDEDEADKVLENMNFAEFKERYRRLIPYMTYYVANNYVNPQVLGGGGGGASHQQQQQLPSYERESSALTTSPFIRKPQRLVSVVAARPTDPRRKPNRQEDKFVPSIQYDPKDIGGDSNYFTPVTYNPKFSYEAPEYNGERVPNPQAAHYDSRYYLVKERQPARPTYEATYLPAPAASATAQRDYLDYESVRYVNIEPPPRTHPKPTRILAQSVPRQPPRLQLPAPTYTRYSATTLQDIVRSLQLTNRLPEMLNKDNVDSSIKTLVEILSILNKSNKHTNVAPISEVENYTYRQPPSHDEYKQVYTRPKVVTETRFQATPSPPPARPVPIKQPTEQNYIEYYTPVIQDIDEVPYKTVMNLPAKENQQIAQNYEISEPLAEIDDVIPEITTKATIGKYKYSHKPLLPPTTLKYGATRGKPNVDYPAYAAIPETEFNCKEQRYKGFFGDPSTDCQVWHYCDLNGGKSSFLCPNGTIFSQVALTCDWWFNVKCESTPQLYVLNERLYKYILPVMPKFPEDFSGPEVDRYLELKFKEMEAKLKEKKLKKQQAKDKVKEKLQALDTDE